jgi:serine protease Do
VVTIIAELPVSTSGMFTQSRPPRAGTGFLMFESETRYYIATNAHVIEGAGEVRVSINGSAEISAVPIGRDDAADLAVIAIYKSGAANVGINSVTIANFGDSDAAQVGEIVVAIGNAMGDGLTVTNGIISAKDIQIVVAGRVLDTLQTNAAINNGNSGGPLVNVFGEVIGINTARLAVHLGEGMAYAIPSHVAKPILERIIKEQGGTEALPRRPIMGVTISSWTETQAAAARDSLLERGIADELIIFPSSGVVLAQVTARSPAQQAGLRVNDIVTAMDGVTLNTADDFIGQMETKRAGDIVTLTVIRDGTQSLQIRVTLVANSNPLF